MTCTEEHTRNCRCHGSRGCHHVSRSRQGMITVRGAPRPAIVTRRGADAVTVHVRGCGPTGARRPVRLPRTRRAPPGTVGIEAPAGAWEPLRSAEPADAGRLRPDSGEAR